VKPLFVKLIPIALKVTLARLVGDDRGAVTIIYAILLVTLLAALGAGMDMSDALQIKYQLDLAADAGSVACTETWQSNIEAGAAKATAPGAFTTLEGASNTAATNQATASFAAQAGLLSTTPFSATPAVSIAVGVTPVDTPTATCTVSYTATSRNYLMAIVGINSLNVSGASKTTVNLAPFAQIYLILDTSASMMVGSTPTDQGKIANWVAANDTGVGASGSIAQGGSASSTFACAVFSSCANLPLTFANDNFNGSGVFPAQDITPCAFACHEEASSTGAFKVSDMQQGETVAHLPAVGAVTRFDVMQQALVNDTAEIPTFCGGSRQVACNPSQTEGLLAYIRDTYETPNTRANLNTFGYNVYGFNYGINGDEPSATVFQQDIVDNSQAKITNASNLPAVAATVNSLTIGLDTHLNPPVNSPHTAVLPALETLVGSTSAGAGGTSENPLKFVIILTDGLNSDRNWNCGPNNCWYPPDPIPGSIAQEPSIDPTTYCAMWNAAPPSLDVNNNPIPGTGTVQISDGIPAWQGLSSPGNENQCQNANYAPGFFLGVTPAVVGTNTTPARDYTGKLNAPAQYLLSGSNSVWYAGPIPVDATGNPSPCTIMKNNGVTIAVLETPYVPMTGQDPIFFPYEGSVQAVIWPQGNPMTNTSSYPIGPNGAPMSALSQALQSCSSGPNFYFQAANDQAIATGFQQLFNSFVGQFVHITQ
jgi:Flp pilus assembly protein TadG